MESFLLKQYDEFAIFLVFLQYSFCLLHMAGIVLETQQRCHQGIVCLQYKTLTSIRIHHLTSTNLYMWVPLARKGQIQHGPYKIGKTSSQFDIERVNAPVNVTPQENAFRADLPRDSLINLR